MNYLVCDKKKQMGLFILNQNVCNGCIFFQVFFILVCLFSADYKDTTARNFVQLPRKRTFSWELHKVSGSFWDNECILVSCSTETFLLLRKCITLLQTSYILALDYCLIYVADRQ